MERPRLELNIYHLQKDTSSVHLAGRSSRRNYDEKKGDPNEQAPWKRRESMTMRSIYETWDTFPDDESPQEATTSSNNPGPSRLAKVLMSSCPKSEARKLPEKRKFSAIPCDKDDDETTPVIEHVD